MFKLKDAPAHVLYAHGMNVMYTVGRTHRSKRKVAARGN